MPKLQSKTIPSFDPSGMIFNEPQTKCEHGKYYTQCPLHPSLSVRGIPPDVWEELQNYKRYIEKKYGVKGWREVLLMMVRKEWIGVEFI